jgi:hypothetical protein
MTRRLAAVAALLVVAACSTTGSGVGKTSQLRDKKGLCSTVTPDMMTKITSCAIVGQPGTLGDDGKTPSLVTTIAGPANSPSADTGSWQVELFRGQELVGKRMMSKNWPPNLNCVLSPCSSWSISVDAVPFDWTPGTYTFRYTLSFDTSRVATNSITIY